MLVVFCVAQLNPCLCAKVPVRRGRCQALKALGCGVLADGVEFDVQSLGASIFCPWLSRLLG